MSELKKNKLLTWLATLTTNLPSSSVNASTSRAIASHMSSPQNSYRLDPPPVLSFVPISSLYGLIASSGRKSPFRPERMRTCCWANATWALVMDSIARALYAGPSNAYAHCFAGFV